MNIEGYVINAVMSASKFSVKVHLLEQDCTYHK
jgi:hypothetical protein